MPARPKRNSRIHLKTLVSRAVILVDHAVFVRKSEKTFRMSYEQISFRIQAAIEFVDQPFLFCFVEINHYVAAKDYVVALGQKLGLQIVEVKMDEILQ